MFLLCKIYDEYEKTCRKMLLPVKDIKNIFEFLEDDNLSDIVKTVIRFYDGTSIYCCDKIEELDSRLKSQKGVNNEI